MKCFLSGPRCASEPPPESFDPGAALCGAVCSRSGRTLWLCVDEKIGWRVRQPRWICRGTRAGTTDICVFSVNPSGRPHRAPWNFVRFFSGMNICILSAKANCSVLWIAFHRRACHVLSFLPGRTDVWWLNPSYSTPGRVGSCGGAGVTYGHGL